MKKNRFLMLALMGILVCSAGRVSGLVNETDDATRAANGEASASAMAQPAPGRLQHNYSALIFGFNPNFIISEVNSVLAVGYNPSIAYNYTFNNYWGVIGLGLSTGLNIQPTNNAAVHEYIIWSCPIALDVSYATNFDLPFYFFVAADCGFIFNFVTYLKQYPNRKNVVDLGYTVQARTGVGYFIEPEQAVALYCSATYIPFNIHYYLALAPGILWQLCLR